ncbi:MAG TPA: hypothetical protein PLZ73_09185 [bacterium]|nr:hypothetical protein [bacterium]
MIGKKRVSAVVLALGLMIPLALPSSGAQGAMVPSRGTHGGASAPALVASGYEARVLAGGEDPKGPLASNEAVAIILTILMVGAVIGYIAYQQ